ncbi:hypothetical protein [Mesonia aquimarina]|uniref:hypothetical protein n=1 Tax=Mesonia aquimarina TaxID=1504967 RepID=UPI000EF5DA1E|nr:hypothetical protein [Mesonia aquimarina]
MKKLLSIGLIVGGLAYYVGRTKFDEYSQTFDKMSVEFLGLQNVKIKNGGLEFETDLKLKNASQKPLDFDSNKNIVLKKIRFFSLDNQYIGEATPNISAISVPANGSAKLENIPTYLPLSDFGGIITNALNIVKGEKLNLQIIVEALGKNYTINA